LWEDPWIGSGADYHIVYMYVNQINDHEFEVECTL